MPSRPTYGDSVDWTRLPLSRATVDRAAHRRTAPDLLAEAWARSSTRVLVVSGASLATRPGPLGAVELDLRRPAELVGFPSVPGPDEGLLLFLGESPDEGAGTVTFLALVLPDALDSSALDVPEPLDEPLTWSALRDAGHALGDRDAGLAATAVGLAAWHAGHPRCPRCGGATLPADGGWLRRCTLDGSDHYPRTDPAVIMAVVDGDDRLLLGHAAHWPERRFSTLAGFVETGESLEAAVRREVAEEAGVVVGEVTYRGSQPWPFPASLMLAYVARAQTTDVVVDGVELTEARWFTRDELAVAVADGAVMLPMRTSVARALIEEWFGATITPPDE